MIWHRVRETQPVFAWLPVPLYVHAGGYFFATDRRAWLRWVRRCWTADGEVFHCELTG